MHGWGEFFCARGFGEESKRDAKIAKGAKHTKKKRMGFAVLGLVTATRREAARRVSLCALRGLCELRVKFL
jgi:hypothetical protein